MMMDKLFSKGPVFMCFGGGGGDSGGGGGGGGNDNDSGGGSNSFTETLANIFTPNDGASYVGGQLVDDNTGSSIAAGGTTSTGNVVSGRANTASNDRDDPAPVVAAQPATVATTATSNLGALPASLAARPSSTEGVENSLRENLANLITPGDGAAYVNGQLINTNTGESLTGGGYATNAAGMQDYIYGVSDDFSNNVLNTTGMTEGEANAAIGKASMLEDLPPGDLAYFASFLPGRFVPIVGDYLGTKMLEGGIEDRKAIIDQQVAALERGAKPLFNNAGEYIGYDDPYESEMEDTFGSGNIFTETTLGASTQNYGLKDGTGNYQVAMNALNDGRSLSGSDINVSTAAQEGGNGGRRGIYGTRGTSEDYDRYSRGGGGYEFMPAYMRKYMTGENFDVMAQQITLADGSTAYRTPDGRVLSPEQFQNTAQAESALTVAGADERYLQGYQDTDAMGMPVYFDAEGNPVGSLG